MRHNLIWLLNRRLSLALTLRTELTVLSQHDYLWNTLYSCKPCAQASTVVMVCFLLRYSALGCREQCHLESPGFHKFSNAATCNCSSILLMLPEVCIVDHWLG